MSRGYFTPFTDKDRQYILDHYLHVPTARIAKYLGCTAPRVHKYAKSQGLVLSPAIRKKFINGSRFKKGRKPLNKGKKQHEYMSAEAIERTKATRFKKGSIPKNTKHFGKPYVTIDSRRKGRFWVIQEIGSNYRQLYTTYLCDKAGIDMRGKVAITAAKMMISEGRQFVPSYLRLDDVKEDVKEVKDGK